MSKRDIDFLFEMGALRRLQRQWSRFFFVDMASISEHSFRVMWIALILARKEGTKNDEKIIKMALLHDITENRTGEVDYLSRQYVERNESLAVKDILEDTSLEKEFLALWEEFDKRETIESKIVKDADNLDIDLELMERKEGNPGLVEFKKEGRKKLVVPNFYTESAKKMWKEIYEADEHGWHKNGRNRMNSGDWKRPDSTS